MRLETTHQGDYVAGMRCAATTHQGDYVANTTRGITCEHNPRAVTTHQGYYVTGSLVLCNNPPGVLRHRAQPTHHGVCPSLSRLRRLYSSLSLGLPTLRLPNPAGRTYAPAPPDWAVTTVLTPRAWAQWRPPLRPQRLHRSLCHRRGPPAVSEDGLRLESAVDPSRHRLAPPCRSAVVTSKLSGQPPREHSEANSLLLGWPLS